MSDTVDIATPALAPAGRRSDPGPRWSTAIRVLFRVYAVYFAVYLAGVQFGLLTPVMPWIGKNLLGIAKPIDTAMNGSGDKTLHYAQWVFSALLAVVVGLLWSVLDRKRLAYPRLHDLVRAGVRYTLAGSMLTYGILKVIPSQFPANEPDRLVQPFGNASPMGLLWAFMGASTAYTVFAGLAELTGGLLLVLRRTALLGALVTIGVMTNVVLLNFCYDVPVKLFSAHLLVFAIVYAVPDLGWLFRAVVLARPVTPGPLWVPFHRRWANIGAGVLQAACVVYLAYSVVSTGRYAYGNWSRPLPRDFGVWRVEEFVRDGVVVPPNLDDKDRWRRLAFNSYGNASVHLMDSKILYRRVDENTDTSLKFSSFEFDESKEEQSFVRSNPEPGVMVLEGAWKSVPIRVKLKHVPVSEFPLNKRGFHWINEWPANY